MRAAQRAARALDPGLLAAAAFAVIAAWPLLARPSLPQFTDAEMHVYRAGEILFSLREGILWPRWAPDFYFGYGYPVFNYYSPLTYHLAAYYAMLTGTDVVAGTKAVLVAAAALGALGVWGFVRDRWGGGAAVVASAAFAFAPYVLYIDPHARGDVPETFALGLGPVLFWAFDRLYRRQSPGALALAALTLAVVILSHPLMALVFFAWLAAWLVWVMVVVPAARRSEAPAGARGRAAGLLLAGLVLGVGLAALYWAPVWLERHAIQLSNVAGPGFFDFRRYFLDPAELTSPAAVFDLGATEPAFRHSLGWPQVWLALAGGLTVFSLRLRRIDLLFFVFSGLGFAYLMTGASLQVWEAIPQMAYFQFPTRFLGPAALALAVLTGAALRWVDWQPSAWGQSAAAAGLVAACLLGAIRLMYLPEWDDFGPVTAERMIGVELEGRALGTTSANDFLPVDVLRVPEPQPRYLAGYATGRIFKVNEVTVPGWAAAEYVEHGPTHDIILTGATEPFLLRLFTFYFPGWHAYIDGEEVPIEVSVPDGFITFWVPPDPHMVLVRFEDTPARRLGYALSAASLLALLALVGRLAWRGRGAARAVAAPAAEARLPRPAALALAVVLLGFGGLKAAADQAGWFRVVSTGTKVEVAQTQQFARVGDDIALLGYDLGRHAAQPGQEIPVTLYWKALQPPGHNYQVYVHLIGEDGRLWGQSDKLNPADFPTTRWPTDRYVRDAHRPRLRADAPPGLYTVVVGLWDAATGERLPVYDEAGQPAGAGVLLSQAVQGR